MAVAGCDVGSLTAKAVIMKEGKVLGHSVIRGGVKPEQSAKEESVKTSLQYTSPS